MCQGEEKKNQFVHYELCHRGSDFSDSDTKTHTQCHSVSDQRSVCMFQADRCQMESLPVGIRSPSRGEARPLLSKQNEWQAAWDVRPHHHQCFFSIFLNWHATLKCRLEITVIVYMTPPPKKISISRTKVGKCLSNTWWRDDEGQRLKGCKRTGERRKRLGEKGGQRREWF